MAAFSIMIIASIIGGFADIGWEVLSSMRAAAFGQSFLSGLCVIALLAMVMDRITRGLAGQEGAAQRPAWLTGRCFCGILVLALFIALVMRIGGIAVSLPFQATRGVIDADARQSLGSEPGRALRRTDRSLQEWVPLLLHPAAAHRDDSCCHARSPGALPSRQR